MDLKKSNKANLEKKQGVRVILGLIISLSLVLISFEWTTMTALLTEVNAAREIPFDMEMIEITRRDDPKPAPKPELPPVYDVIKPVDNDIPLEDYNFDREVTEGTNYDFTVFPDDKPEQIIKPEDFVVVEDMPIFNEGDPKVEFCRYIFENLRYPEIAAENGVSGKVQVRFVVNSLGYVERATITRSVDPALDNEALRVIMSSPKWIPGKQRGKAVNVIFTFPINFVLH